MKNGLAKHQLLYFFSLAIYIANTGCNKSNQAPPLTPNYNVYMAGSMDGKAVYWKNGIPTILSDSGVARSIVVKGTDIYVCGAINQGAKSYAVYWKNGKEITLEKNLSAAMGIAVEGNDIYIVGNIYRSDTARNAVYWKNGVLSYLSPESKGFASAITVSGQQVYISGDTYSYNSDSAIVWKNGQKNFLGEIGSMRAVGFNGADTFYVGTLHYEPTYWLNNITTTLYKNGFAYTVAFSGTDVYIGGGVRPNLNDNYAAIWKNDSLTILTDQYTNSAVSGIAIAGADVYAVGYINDKFNESPVYWKNGVLVKIGNNGQVYSIAIGQ